MTEPIDDVALLAAIRREDPTAWEALIQRYQGRLLAFATSRLKDPAAAEDVVQEAFIGFLTSLPNYDERTPLEAFLFAITSHKLTDALRRRGVRPRLMGEAATTDATEPVSRQRKVSSLAKSQERRKLADRVLGDSLSQLVRTWISRAEYERLMCSELLFLRGYPNKEVARTLSVSEQSVANHKAFVVQKLKDIAQRSKLQDDEYQLD